MISSYIIPTWFAGFGILMEFLFGIISFGVSFFAYKIYKISKEKSIEKFSWGFLFISISYILWAMINFFLVTEMQDNSRILNLEHLQITGLIGVYVHMALFLIGLITIFYSNFRTNKTETYLLLIGLGLLSAFSYTNVIAAFHMTSTLVLFFINYHYLKEIIENKNKKILPISIEFIFLFLSHSSFIFPVTYFEYVIAHFFELIAYSFILISLIKTVKIKPQIKIP